MGPSSLAVLDGHGACGACLPQCDSGPHDTARDVGDALGVPAPGPHTRRAPLRHRAGRRTIGLVPAARGRPRLRLLSLAPRHRSAFAAAPVDSNAPPRSAVPPGRRAHRCIRPPPGGAHFGHASAGAPRACVRPGFSTNRGKVGCCAPRLRVPAGQRTCAGRA